MPFKRMLNCLIRLCAKLLVTYTLSPRGKVSGGIVSFFEVQFNGEIASIQIHKIGHGLNDKCHRNVAIRGGGNGDHAVPHVPHICFRNPEQGQGSIPVCPRLSVCVLWFLLCYTRHRSGRIPMGLRQARAFL